MRKFQLISVSPLHHSNYIKPYQMRYKLEDEEYFWDFYKTFDSVGILLYHEENKSLLLLKHARPCAILADGITQNYELCAGLVDKRGKTLKEIAQEEILEECGYQIPTHRLELIQTFFSNIGLSPAKQTLFFATIHPKEKIAQGGGERDENFETFFLKTSEILDFLRNPNISKTASLAFMLQWFYIEKMERNQ